MSRSFWLLASGLSLALIGCRESTPVRSAASTRGGGGSNQQEQTTTSPQEQPDTVPPADVSHGEAKIGGPEAEPAPVAPELPRAEPGRLHRIRLEMSHASIVIAPGVRYAAWTFGGRVPGPPIHIRQGDTVDFTLINRANIPHSMDFHAAEIAPSKYYVNVLPNDSLHYRFVARVPGAFMYHCGTAPAAMHIANGMYGAIVVDPAKPRPRAREFVLVQSEFYLTPKAGADGTHSLDWQRLLSMAPDHVVFNGRASQYATHPIDVRPWGAPAVLRGERGTQPDQLIPRGRRHLRSGIPGRITDQSVDGSSDRERPGWGRQHLRAATARGRRLPLRHPRLCRCNQGRGRGAARAGSGPEGRRSTRGRALTGSRLPAWLAMGRKARRRSRSEPDRYPRAALKPYEGSVPARCTGGCPGATPCVGRRRRWRWRGS